VGTADFNGNGKSDLLWRDGNAGAALMWLMWSMSGLQIASLPCLDVTTGRAIQGANAD
jgi:hypothetical protein